MFWRKINKEIALAAILLPYWHAISFSIYLNMWAQAFSSQI